MEPLLVANACSDDSAEICVRLARENGNIRLISTSRKGWGNAVRMGLMEACGDLVCYTNSARTAPNDLVSVISYALERPDVVVKATRKVRTDPGRKLGSCLYNLECRLLFCLKVRDINGTPKLFRAPVRPTSLACGKWRSNRSGVLRYLRKKPLSGP